MCAFKEKLLHCKRAAQIYYTGCLSIITRPKWFTDAAVAADKKMCVFNSNNLVAQILQSWSADINCITGNISANTVYLSML
jgi:hypothetical protein